MLYRPRDPDRVGRRLASPDREYRGFYDAAVNPQVDLTYVNTRGMRVRKWLPSHGGGFAWGNGASDGRLRLAMALVAASCGLRVAALRGLHFRMQVVDTLPREWRLTEADIRRAVMEKE